MNIETFVSIKPTIQNGKLIIIFESNDNIITELRVLKVADEIHKLLETSGIKANFICIDHNDRCNCHRIYDEAA